MKKREEQTPSPTRTPQPQGDDLGNPQDERQRNRESEETDEEIE